MPDHLDEMQRAIGRLEGKFDTFTETVLKQMAAQDDRAAVRDVHVDKVEGRLRKVENKQWWLAGLGTAAGAIVGLLSGHGFKLPQ